MLLRFDHVVLGVADLNNASNAFEDAGFDVFDRGNHTGPLANRLIRFADRSFIELVAVVGPGQHRFREPIGKRNGWIDYAISVERLECSRRMLKDADVPVGDIRRVVQPALHGGQWEMDLLLVGLGVGSPAMPFLIEDITPFEMRFPPLEPGREQPCGASGIAGATVVVPSLEHVLSSLIALYGSPTAVDKSLAGPPVSARFDFNGRWVQFAVPYPKSEAAAYLERWGEGLYSVTLQSPDGKGNPLSVGDNFGAALFL